MPLVGKIARRMGRSPDIEDDLKGQGYVALCEAADLFEPEAHQGLSFAAFARRRIVKRMQEALNERPVVHIPRRRLADAHLTRSDLGVNDYGTLPAAKDPELAEMLSHVMDALDCCTTLERQALTLFRGLDGPAQSIDRIAIRLKITRREARAALDQAHVTVAEAIRYQGWTSEGWAEALAG